MALTIAVRVTNPTGWLGSDDVSYHSAAEYLLAGQTIDRVHHHYARMAVIVPVAVSMLLFGESAFTVALPMFVASVLCVAMVAFVGKLLWGWWEGLCAATVVSVLPFFLAMSTTAYTDAFVCFWATLAVLLALTATRATRPATMTALGVACGFSVGLAVSAKVFSVLVLFGAAPIGWTLLECSRRRKVLWIGSVGCGLLGLFLADGLFYLWFADDFWFKLHAIRNHQAMDRYFPQEGYFQATTFAQLAWDRMTMLFRPAQSGWGRAAILFWPAALLVFACDKRGRGIACWAIVTYVFIALVPVNYRHHRFHPFPEFEGRHILMACVPFALCFAWMAHRAGRTILQPVRLRRSWPLLMLAIVVLSRTSYGAPNGFCHRPTQRIGEAITRIIASTEWEDGREIFMSAPLYIRYRILFPDELRMRLRVVVDEDAPTWWRSASVDIVSRRAELPAPDRAYLIATPDQLDGEPEHWSYGIGLPDGDLDSWRRTSPLVTMGVHADKSVARMRKGDSSVRPLLVLLGETSHEQARIASGDAEVDRPTGVPLPLTR